MEVTSSKHQNLLTRVAKSVGIGESEVSRQAFMEYAKSMSLITERVDGKL